MKIILYTGNNCHQCKEVIDFMNKNRLDYREINIDQSEQYPPIPLFVYPALFIDGILEAYGIDIIERLRRLEQ